MLSSPPSIIITNDDGSTKKIEEPNEMFEQIIKHNKQHFNQAHGTPPTTQPMLNIIGNGLDSKSQQLLDGKATIPHNIPSLMQKFLRNLKQTHQHEEAPIFPKEKIKSAFRKWKESTTTSPSGIHLGHYKALLAPNFTQDQTSKQQSEYIWNIIYIIINASIQVGNGPKR